MPSYGHDSGAWSTAASMRSLVRILTVLKMPSENITPRRWYYGGLRNHHDF